MSACEECLRASVLRSEALSFAESRFASTVQAAELLALDPREMIDALRPDHPSVDGIVEDATDRIAEVVDDEFWIVCRHEPEFPARLLDFPNEKDVPSVLYGYGRRSLFEQLTTENGVAVVGARRATAYGREVAYSLANEMSAVGLVVVSGMALGIDGAAHRGALQGGGRTIAVLAGGSDTPYPRSHRLLHEQIVAAGCVVSENPPGTQARRWSFVARNRLIAGMAAVTIFVEGSEESGARHTVRFAQELDARVGVVPGPITSPMSAGPNALLGEDGVFAVTGTDVILEELALELGPPRLPGITGKDDSSTAQVLDQIAAGARTPRALAAALPELTPREISRALGRLELHGRVVRGASGEYERVL